MTEQFIIQEGDKRYRMLQIGERLEKGDQYKYRGSRGVWNDVMESVLGVPLTDPKDNLGFPAGYYRRPIAEVAE